MEKIRFLAVAVCVVLTAIVLHGCAPSSAYVSARQIETASAQFVDTAADTWHAYSHARLENMKDACADLACFKTTSSQWESGTVAQVDKAIVAAREAVYAYDRALTTASSTKNGNYEGAIQSLIQAMTALVTILNGYGVNVAAFVAKGL